MRDNPWEYDIEQAEYDGEESHARETIYTEMLPETTGAQIFPDTHT